MEFLIKKKRVAGIRLYSSSHTANISAIRYLEDDIMIVIAHEIVTINVLLRGNQHTNSEFTHFLYCLHQLDMYAPYCFFIWLVVVSSNLKVKGTPSISFKNSSFKMSTIPY